MAMQSNFRRRSWAQQGSHIFGIIESCYMDERTYLVEKTPDINSFGVGQPDSQDREGHDLLFCLLQKDTLMLLHSWDWNVG